MPFSVPDISADSIVARTSNFHSCTGDGRFMITNLARSGSFLLDEMTERVWELLANPSPVSAVCQLAAPTRPEGDTLPALEYVEFM
jgi:hypothetical protein